MLEVFQFFFLWDLWITIQNLWKERWRKREQELRKYRICEEHKHLIQAAPGLWRSGSRINFHKMMIDWKRLKVTRIFVLSKDERKLRSSGLLWVSILSPFWGVYIWSRSMWSIKAWEIVHWKITLFVFIKIYKCILKYFLVDAQEHYSFLWKSLWVDMWIMTV